MYSAFVCTVQDYYNLNFTLMLGTNPSGMAALMDIVDPINYVNNMTMAKLVVDATGDEFFMPGTITSIVRIVVMLRRRRRRSTSSSSSSSWSIF